MADKRGAERRPVDAKRVDRAARGARHGLAAGEHPQTLGLRRRNWILLSAGLLSILLGFAVLSTGEITLAPILILLGYLVLIPWSLVARTGSRPDAPAGDPKGR